MKNRVSKIVLSIFAGMSVSQFASPAALSVTCANPIMEGIPDMPSIPLPEEGTDMMASFPFVIDDDYKNAAIKFIFTNNDGSDVNLPFECNGQKSLDANLKCHRPLESGDGDWTFTRDTKNKMSMEVKIMGLLGVGVDVTITYECLEHK